MLEKRRVKFEQALADVSPMEDGSMHSVLTSVCTDLAYIDGLVYTLENCGPLKVFKYQKNDWRNRDDIERGLVHLSPVGSMNDVYEAKQKFTTETMAESWASAEHDEIALKIDGILRSIGRTPRNPVTTGTLDNFVGMAIAESNVRTEVLRNALRCGCFSEDPLDPNMWDRYASGHEGFVAEYTVSRFVIGCAAGTRRSGGGMTLRPMPPGVFFPVSYGKRDDLSDMFPALFCSVYNGWPTGLGYAYAVRSLHRKGSHWETEREWRIATVSPTQREKETLYAIMSPEAIYMGQNACKNEAEADALVTTAQKIGANLYRVCLDEQSDDFSMKSVPVVM